VELDEVEAALLSHPAVEEAATYVITEGDGTVLIRAAATLAGHEVEEAALRRHMATSLPGYALPTSIEIVDDFPRTTTGKIDRKSLAERAGALIREGSRA
jgi:acyl-coenzyme A synthetase/AMP-(fatty) acid ligase